MDATLEPLVPWSGASSSLTPQEQGRIVAALRATRSEGTRRAYAHHWAQWERWCADLDRPSFPADPEHLAAYITWLAQSGRAVSTIDVAMAAVRAVHEDAGLESPTRQLGVTRVRAGVTRQVGLAPRRQAHPLSTDELGRLLATCTDGVRGVRDRALLLVGYAGALRRSEIADLGIPGILKRRDGVILTLSRSKGDQAGAGVPVPIPMGQGAATCPVTALFAWLDLLGVTTGPVFRPISRHNSVPVTTRALSGESVDRIIQARARQAGLAHLGITGHSLRAGHATTAAENGADVLKLARTLRHARLETTATYTRPAEAMRDTTARILGL